MTHKPLVDMTTTEALEFIHAQYSGRMDKVDWSDVATRENLILRFGMLIGIGLRLAHENAEARRQLAAARAR